MGGLAILCCVLLLGMVVMGVRAILQGRDIVWECSWQFPIVLAIHIKRIWHMSARIAGTYIVRCFLPPPQTQKRRHANARVHMPLGELLASMLPLPETRGRRSHKVLHYQSSGARQHAQHGRKTTHRRVA